MSQENLNIAGKASNSEPTAEQPGAKSDEGEQNPANAVAPEQPKDEAPKADEPANGEAKTDEGDKPQGAPEKYEFNFAEGEVIDPAILTEFETIAREQNLTQEQADKFVGLGPKLAEAIVQKQLENFNNTMNEWAQQTKTDKEIGGDGLDQKLSVAVTALEKFASPELRQMLEAFDVEKNPKGTGLGQHPEVIRLFYRIGQAISEDSIVRGREPAPQLSPAEKLYGNANKK